jgi:hypothetical protein
MSDIQHTRTPEQKRRIAAMSVCFRALQYWCDRAVTEVDRDFAISQLRAALAGLEGRKQS